MQIKLPEIERYLREKIGRPIIIDEVRPLGTEDTTTRESIKQFGYGRPLLVSYRLGDLVEKLVLHSIHRNAFGRERDDDRMAAVWLDFHTFNCLPRHVSALDLVVHMEDGSLRSIASADEMLLVTRYRPGDLYAEDLARIRDEGKLTSQDIQRAEILASYLAEIHQVKHDDLLLWRRRLRDLVGHGEGIMGITDSYSPDQAFVNENELEELENLSIHWRWRLKPLSHRLSQVHGDFHPFNVLFEEGLEFHLLDRSRGKWGEPADDVSCMDINYLFFSLQRYGQLEGPFQMLHDRFWESYLNASTDDELTQVIQPWFAWRALVVASPVWYPTIENSVRRKLLTFAQQVLLSQEYDFAQANRYLEEI
jgi:aminoglycoside phosphotransferase family enzyme